MGCIFIFMKGRKWFEFIRGGMGHDPEEFRANKIGWE
jgi:hypothetical protein